MQWSVVLNGSVLSISSMVCCNAVFYNILTPLYFSALFSLCVQCPISVGYTAVSVATSERKMSVTLHSTLTIIVLYVIAHDIYPFGKCFKMHI